MRQSTTLRAALALLGLALAGLVVAGCGGSDNNGSQAPSDQANNVDRAFVRSMIPHHKSAIAMAKMAQKNAKHAEIKTLALNVVTTQSAEVDQLNGIAKSIGTKPAGDGGMSGMSHGGHSMGDSSDVGTLGLTDEEAGMSMDMSSLDTAKPFDRVFIDMMVRHHEGAVRMAQVELARGKNSELKVLARKIVSAQKREIKEMNGWRADWYGGPVPKM